MKNTMIKFLFLSFISISMIACKGSEAKQEEPKEIAEEANEPITDNTKLDDDINFMINTAEKGLLEVQATQLAQTRSKNPQIVKMSKMLEADHTAANNELSKAAASKNITIPSSLGDKSTEKFNELNEKQGADFDKEYLKFLVDGHEESVKDYEKEANKGNDLDIKAWAATRLPILQKHLDEAKMMLDQMK